ncbi:MAG: hypothetical protein ACI9J3_000073 [Parvicellaceae bacterium]|jgi:hypothetical protein
MSVEKRNKCTPKAALTGVYIVRAVHGSTVVQEKTYLN